MNPQSEDMEHGDLPPLFRSLDLSSLSVSDRFGLLSSLVVPRPIAWIVSRNGEGKINVAPFSYFNVISADPPLVAVSFAEAADRPCKDTLANILQTADFVINLVPENLAFQMSSTAVNAPSDVSEAPLAGLGLQSCALSGVPRILGCPVALECSRFQTIRAGGGTTIVLGTIVQAHVQASVFSNPETLAVDSTELHLVAHMQGTSYCRTQDTFKIERVSWSTTDDVPAK